MNYKECQVHINELDRVYMYTILVDGTFCLKSCLYLCPSGTDVHKIDNFAHLWHDSLTKRSYFQVNVSNILSTCLDKLTFKTIHKMFYSNSCWLNIWQCMKLWRPNLVWDISFHSPILPGLKIEDTLGRFSSVDWSSACFSAWGSGAPSSIGSSIPTYNVCQVLT